MSEEPGRRWLCACKRPDCGHEWLATRAELKGVKCPACFRKGIVASPPAYAAKVLAERELHDALAAAQRGVSVEAVEAAVAEAFDKGGDADTVLVAACPSFHEEHGACHLSGGHPGVHVGYAGGSWEHDLEPPPPATEIDTDLLPF